ncbi:MAG: VOC family protein [Alphaproteobacteria bacterium]|nr:VOC family protein [Alphaproteobacteria bacterium]
MSLSTYLYFDGQCGEAFELYKSVFGGAFASWNTYGDGPPEMGASDDEKGRIMHVSLPVGDSVLMGSDTLSSFGEPAKPGNNFAISFAPKTKAEADDVIAKLAAGGEISMAMNETFWGSYFGMCTDKFGVHWMLNLDLNAK